MQQLHITRCTFIFSEHACSQPKKVGPCEALIPSWYYNTKTQSCQLFYYGGCLGNENNFQTRGDCYTKCIGKYIDLLLRNDSEISKNIDH